MDGGHPAPPFRNPGKDSIYQQTMASTIVSKRCGIFVHAQYIATPWIPPRACGPFARLNVDPLLINPSLLVGGCSRPKANNPHQTQVDTPNFMNGGFINARLLSPASQWLTFSGLIRKTIQKLAKSYSVRTSLCKMHQRIGEVFHTEKPRSLPVPGPGASAPAAPSTAAPAPGFPGRPPWQHSARAAPCAAPRPEISDTTARGRRFSRGVFYFLCGFKGKTTGKPPFSFFFCFCFFLGEGLVVWRCGIPGTGCGDLLG